jgi:peptidoglycan L-alanyl-D-glutamate endopeptidase CwlK
MNTHSTLMRGWLLHSRITCFPVAATAVATVLVSSLPCIANTGSIPKEQISQSAPSPGPGWNAKVDERSEKVIEKLNLVVQPYARELVRRAAAKGIEVKVIGGFRSIDEQQRLFCQGRNIPECSGLYKPGPIVTNARGGYSNHNFGIAFDIGIFQGSRYLTDSPKYNEVGQIGKSIGLEWGGDWTSIRDRPHFQLRPSWAMHLSEKDMLKELRRRSAATPKIPFFP